MNIKHENLLYGLGCWNEMNERSFQTSDVDVTELDNEIPLVKILSGISLNSPALNVTRCQFTEKNNLLFVELLYIQ